MAVHSRLIEEGLERGVERQSEAEAAGKPELGHQTRLAPGLLHVVLDQGRAVSCRDTEKVDGCRMPQCGHV